MKQRKNSTTILIVAILIGLSCALCHAFAYEPFMEQIDRSPNKGDFYPEDYYSINPRTVISDLDKGLPNVFSPIAEPSDSFQENYDNSFQWKQSDFIKTATALNFAIGKDNITDWKFDTVVFRSPCKDYDDGFLEAHFILFRPFWAGLQLYYEAREIVIDPSRSVVRWGDGIAYPRPVFGWDKIKLDKFKITAEEALMIAEERGGKNMRGNDGNNCNIFVIGKYDEWLVLYSPIISYRIDAYTGEILEISD